MVYTCKVQTNDFNLPIVVKHFFRSHRCNQNAAIFTIISESSVKTFLRNIPSFNRKDIVTCDNCEKQTTRVTFARRKRSCSFGKLHCPKCLNISTCSQADINFHIAKKRSLSQSKNVNNCHFCHQFFADFCCLRLHKQNVHNVQGLLESIKVEATEMAGATTDESLSEKLQKFKHFLVDSEVENGRRRLSNYPIEK